MTRTLVLALLVLAALPAAASAVVVPQRGMKGVRIGDTVGEVRARLGTPDASAVVDNEIIGRQRVFRYGRTRISFNGATRTSTVITMTTTSRRERLANGIGVGSTRRAVARRVRGVRCRIEFGVDHCQIGRSLPGRRVTDFLIGRNKRVKRITVGVVID